VLTRLRPRRGDERGVTLVEVLVAITLLAIVMVPLSNALIAFFRNTNTTTDRLSESHDEQIMAAYFAQDVQSIGVRTWTVAPYALQTSLEQNAPPTTGLFPCGAASTPNATLRMAWNDPQTATTNQTVIVSYVVETSGGVTTLHRLRCDSGSTTPSSDLVVAHNVLSVGTPVLTGPATIPQAISWTINIRATTDPGLALAVVLYGQRRQT
jgi:prepilin-type N-terminal cleavage/methylation domain-containing protein